MPMITKDVEISHYKQKQHSIYSKTVQYAQRKHSFLCIKFAFDSIIKSIKFIGRKVSEILFKKRTLRGDD